MRPPSDWMTSGPSTGMGILAAASQSCRHPTALTAKCPRFLGEFDLRRTLELIEPLRMDGPPLYREAVSRPSDTPKAFHMGTEPADPRGGNLSNPFGASLPVVTCFPGWRGCAADPGLRSTTASR